MPHYTDMSDDVEMIEAVGGTNLNEWYPELDLGWPNPAAQFNHGRKRSREETDVSMDAGVKSRSGWENKFNPVVSTGSDYGSLTPDLSSESGTDGVLSLYDGAVEEIPRTKMQTGCIPCLYVRIS
jgi:hypothetical protein